jgi:TetR/AcrR family transcriptional regulator, lmrAB and yxaGH operons repressor
LTVFGIGQQLAPRHPIAPEFVGNDHSRRNCCEMMPAKAVRDVRCNKAACEPRMTEAAVRLLATKSVEGAAFADVLAATDAPRGSVYHHFPSGKTELLHAALDLASERGLEIIEATRGQSAAVVAGRFLGLWRELLDRSHFSAGCAVVAVTVAANDAKLLDHAGTIFRAWTERLSDLLVAGGLRKAAANQLATMLVAATEGAVVLCRAQRSREPFDRVAATLLRLTKT